MNSRFLERELVNFQKKFNQTFGNRIVHNIKARQAALLAVLHLGVLKEKINKEQNNDKKKKLMTDFVRKRNILNRFFQETAGQQNQAKEVRSEKIQTAANY